MAKSEIFTKKNAANSSKTLGAVAAGIVISHAAHSFTPSFGKPALDIAVPFGVSGVGFVGAMATKNPIAKTMMLAGAAYSFLQGGRKLVNHLSTPNADGTRKMSEKTESIINKVLPLGCPDNPLLAGLGNDEALDASTVDLTDIEIIDSLEDELNEGLELGTTDMDYSALVA